MKLMNRNWPNMLKMKKNLSVFFKKLFWRHGKYLIVFPSFCLYYLIYFLKIPTMVWTRDTCRRLKCQKVHTCADWKFPGSFVQTRATGHKLYILLLCTVTLYNNWTHWLKLVIATANGVWGGDLFWNMHTLSCLFVNKQLSEFKVIISSLQSEKKYNSGKFFRKLRLY